MVCLSCLLSICCRKYAFCFTLLSVSSLVHTRTRTHSHSYTLLHSCSYTTHAHTNTHVHAHTHTCTHPHMHTHYTCTHPPHMHTHIPHAHINMHIHTKIRTCTQKHTHVHMHTHHVRTHKTCKQASNKLYALALISSYLNERKRKLLMKSFIISQFNYCPIVWMYFQRTSNNLISRIHERSSRIAYNDYVSDFSSLFDKDESVNIHQRNIHALALEIYETIDNLNPNFTDEIFCVKQHNYPTEKNKI